MIRYIILLFALFGLTTTGSGQTTPVTASGAPASDSNSIEILPGVQRLRFQKLADGTELQILAGNVKIRQGTTLFYTDSCVVNTTTRIFEAFGRVHINDSDTAHVYANYLKYLINPRYAYLKGAVRLTDGHGTLTTNELEYDVATKVGTYKNGGKVINNKSVLTSREGIYYADLHEVFFKRNVELKDPAYFLSTDSMIYNTESQIARLVTKTFIRDSANRKIYTSEGYYDIKNRYAHFTQRTTIEDGALRVTGDRIASDETAGIVQIEGNGVLIDTAQGVNILANQIFANKKTGAYLATKDPLMIIKQENDSIFITADTLFSAKLSDRFARIDSSGKVLPKPVKDAKDSTDRYFEAFRNVRIFSDSLQSVSDSLFYSFKDSTFRLFQNPVVWSNGNQITGDTIYLFTKKKKAERLQVINNSFLINEVEPGVYNQVKASLINGYFKEGQIDSVRATGLAESIYFVVDDDSAYTGVNQTTSDAMDVYFQNGDLKKVVFRSAVKGTLWPISQKRPSEMRLAGFLWLEDRRPKTKYELME